MEAFGWRLSLNTCPTNTRSDSTSSNNCCFYLTLGNYHTWRSYILLASIVDSTSIRFHCTHLRERDWSSCLIIIAPEWDVSAAGSARTCMFVCNSKIINLKSGKTLCYLASDQWQWLVDALLLDFNTTHEITYYVEEWIEIGVPRYRRPPGSRILLVVI